MGSVDKKAIESHLATLIQRGSDLVARIPREGSSSFRHWIPEEMISDMGGWITSAANIIQSISTPSSQFFEESKQAVADSRKAGHNGDIPSTAAVRMFGILRAADSDWRSGHLRRVEYIVAAATFDDFLQHAEEYHRGGHFREASVLASAVLEDSVRRICERHGVSWIGLTLFPRIDGLESAGVLTKPEATRAKRWAETRNRTDHAEWEKIDGRDVGSMISGIRDLIADHL